VHALTRRLQRIAKDSGHEQPLLIGIDQENGLVSAFVPPGGQAGTQLYVTLPPFVVQEQCVDDSTAREP
jgi:hypothetical protein